MNEETTINETINNAMSRPPIDSHDLLSHMIPIIMSNATSTKYKDIVKKQEITQSNPNLMKNKDLAKKQESTLRSSQSSEVRSS